MLIERHSDARAINAVLNNPDVRPWVADVREGVLDITPQVENRNNVLLMGEHGGCLFFKLMAGLYEVHSQVLPAGRGEWFAEFSTTAATWMFLNTDAAELITRVPHGHPAAKAATMKAGGRYQWTRDRECLFHGEVTAVDIYSLSLMDWANRVPGMVELGRDFHDELNREAAKLGIADHPHDDDENHNRFVGISLSMMRAGQYVKGAAFYNRWSVASRHATISLISLDPPTIKMDIGLLSLEDGGIRLTLCH